MGPNSINPHRRPQPTLMPDPRILSIATATPPYRLDQSQVMARAGERDLQTAFHDYSLQSVPTRISSVWATARNIFY